MVLEHVDGCLWGARHPPIRSLIDENSWAVGGTAEKLKFAGCRPPAHVENAKLHNLRLNQ